MECKLHNHTFPESFFVKDGHEVKKCENSNSKSLCNDDNCEDCYNRSFASHIKAKHWSYEKNGSLCPRKITLGSHAKIWFKCNNCPHYFIKILKDITNKSKQRWCPFCTNQKLCDDESCIICYEKEFSKP